MPRAEQSPKVGFSMVIFRGAGGGGGPGGGGCRCAQYVNYRESNFKSGLKRGMLSRHNGRVINIPSSKQRADCTVLRNTESPHYCSYTRESPPNDGARPGK